MLVINLEEQLQPGTFGHAIHNLIENKIDPSAFRTHYITDNDSAKLRTIQRYNGVATVDKKHRDRLRQERPLNPRVPASEFTFDQVKQTCVCTAGDLKRLRQTTEDKMFFEARLLSCRHCCLKQQCMRNPDAADHRKGHGRQVSFLISEKRKVTYTDWMKHRVDSDYGKQIYSHRMSTVEPVFGSVEHNKGLKRFSLRGKEKVNCQWQLYCLVHNLEKLSRYGQLAA
jgi:hypothetical protein